MAANQVACQLLQQTVIHVPPVAVTTPLERGDGQGLKKDSCKSSSASVQPKTESIVVDSVLVKKESLGAFVEDRGQDVMRNETSWDDDYMIPYNDPTSWYFQRMHSAVVDPDSTSDSGTSSEPRLMLTATKSEPAEQPDHLKPPLHEKSNSKPQWVFDRALEREYHRQKPDWVFKRAASREFEREKPWYFRRADGRWKQRGYMGGKRVRGKWRPERG